MAIRYVALLRGINVGGHRLISKESLTEVFAEAGFKEVQTLLASGNVVFSAESTDEESVRETVESALEASLDYHVDVMIRTVAYMAELVRLNPFAQYDTSGAKFYVTLLSSVPAEKPDLPQKLNDQGAEAVGLDDRAFFAVSYKREGSYGDFSKYLTQTFGKQPVTTRNWNTIVKLAAFADEQV